MRILELDAVDVISPVALFAGRSYTLRIEGWQSMREQKSSQLGNDERVSRPLYFEVCRGGSIAEAAIALRRSIYAADLIPDPDDGLDKAAVHVVSRDAQGDVVAAFRVLGPEQRPFDFEEVYPLDALVAARGRPALIGRLCVRRDYRNVKHSTRLLKGLLGEAMTLAEDRSFTDYFLYTFEHLRTFYSRGGFVETGKSVEHAHWGRLFIMHMSIPLASRTWGSTGCDLIRTR